MKLPLFVLLLCSVLASGAALAEGNTLSVTLNGLKNAQGNVRVGLYQDSDSFRKESRALAVEEIPARAGSVKLRFADLAAGRYAIMAYHDEDANGQLNRRFGMFPTEGYGLSNNPTVVGPPAFADSAFEVAGATRISIDIRY